MILISLLLLVSRQALQSLLWAALLVEWGHGRENSFLPGLFLPVLFPKNGIFLIAYCLLSSRILRLASVLPDLFLLSSVTLFRILLLFRPLCLAQKWRESVVLISISIKWPQGIALPTKQPLTYLYPSFLLSLN